jgi:hypothetical protein
MVILCLILAGFNSLKALAYQNLDTSQNFVLNNGVVIPLGKKIEAKYDRKKNIFLGSETEYVVYDNEQVKIRYLIEVRYILM